MSRYFYLRANREYFVFALLIAISLALFQLNDNEQIRHLRVYGLAAFGILKEPLSSVTELFTLRTENKRLREVNIELADKVYQLREARLENIRLRKMLNFQERSTYDMVAARIVGRAFDPIRNTITINVGTNDGVGEQMPIVNESGLVGRVIFVGTNYSIGQILLNRDFRTSAKVERSRVDGILRWNGTSGLILANVAKTLDVLEGDVIVTSEYSNIFPPGIQIGVVTQVQNVPGRLTKDIRITPSVDFSHLDEVFVLLYHMDEEKMEVEHRAQR